MHPDKHWKSAESSRLPLGFGFGGYIPRTISLDESVDPFSNDQDKSPEQLMLLALIESMRGVGCTIPNPAVGCILSANGDIVASGATEAFGGKHAERVAFENLRTAGRSTAGLDAYVTLEPCSHHGKQPPCCELFQGAGINTLYVAVGDPNPMVMGQGLSFAQRQVQSVHIGLAQRAVTAWHLPFLAQHRLGRPLVVAKWAQTLDGAFADLTGKSKWITGAEARAHGHWLRLKYDVTAIGLGTLLIDHPSLTVRDCWRPNDRQPHVCVVDVLGEARADDPNLLEALTKITQAATGRKVALATTAGNREKLKKIPNFPAEILELPLLHDSNSLLAKARAISELWTSDCFTMWLGRSAQSIFVEGGAQLISSLLEIDAIDLMHVFVAPILIAGNARRLVRSNSEAPSLDSASHFDIHSTFTLGDDILLELVPRRITEMFFNQG